MPALLFVSGMNDDPLNCAPGGANKARMPSQRKCKVHLPESRCVKLHLSNKLQVLNCRAICFLAQTPGCAAIRHHKKSPRFFFHNEPIPKREAHLSLPFYTGPVSDALFSIQAAAGCGVYSALWLFETRKWRDSHGPSLTLQLAETSITLLAQPPVL